eukprot:s1511_g11.t1
MSSACHIEGHHDFQYAIQICQSCGSVILHIICLSYDIRLESSAYASLAKPAPRHHARAHTWCCHVLALPVMQIQQQRNQRPSRAELTAMGLTPAQADHELVRQSELEVIETSITRWVMLFGCIICALLPVSLVLFFYLIYSYVLEQRQDCDVPLVLWFWVAMFNIFYHINLGGRSIHRQVIRTGLNLPTLAAGGGSECLRCSRRLSVCRYQAPEQSLEVPPARVRLYHWLTTIFVFSQGSTEGQLGQLYHSRV